MPVIRDIKQYRNALKALKDRRAKAFKYMDRFVPRPNHIDVPLEQLRRANVPDAITKHLTHESISKVMQLIHERREIKEAIEKNIKILEDLPHMSEEEAEEKAKSAILNIFNLYSKAEENIIEASDYHFDALNRVVAVRTALEHLYERTDEHHNEDIRQAIDDLYRFGDYLIDAHNRHLTLLDFRSEMKSDLINLLNHLDIDLGRDITELTKVKRPLISIDYIDQKYVEKLVRSMLDEVNVPLKPLPKKEINPITEAARLVNNPDEIKAFAKAKTKDEIRALLYILLKDPSEDNVKRAQEEAIKALRLIYKRTHHKAFIINELSRMPQTEVVEKARNQIR
ncbi:MAG: hypothetical protein J7K68_02070 [Candidatus Diapherotrites archaeon]|nr:hypothetical protein [Candidatus Diapherotrites archaeon]